VANVPALEAPIDRLLQEVQGRVVILQPSTPHSSLKLAPRQVETGLAPLLEVIQGDNVIEEPMVVVLPSLPPGGKPDPILAPSAAVQGPSTEPSAIQCVDFHHWSEAHPFWVARSLFPVHSGG
jgi:hypothetical protein